MQHSFPRLEGIVFSAWKGEAKRAASCLSSIENASNIGEDNGSSADSIPLQIDSSHTLVLTCSFGLRQELK